MKRTERLTRDALGKLDEPYSEDVTDEALGIIENDPDLFREYMDIASSFKNGKAGVNQAVGRFVKKITEREVLSWPNPCQRNSLATAYSKLVDPRDPTGPKLTPLTDEFMNVANKIPNENVRNMICEKYRNDVNVAKAACDISKIYAAQFGHTA